MFICFGLVGVLCFVLFLFDGEKEMGETYLKDNILKDQATGAVFWKSCPFNGKPEQKP